MPTKIEWTQETWNPVTGCTPISPGCAHCYAERMARRLAGRYGYPEAPHHFDVTLHPERLDQPLRWKKPRMIFVCSMGDLFHEDVPDDFILQVWQVMFKARRHTFQVLTKRPGRMLAVVSEFENLLREKPVILPNVWLGVTAENQEQADKRIPILLQTPAAVRFVSVEPMLGAVDIERYLLKPSSCSNCGAELPLRRKTVGPVQPCPNCDQYMYEFKRGIHLVIVGGESGPRARPMHPDWARLLRDQCQAAGVPFFMKQMGTAWAISTALGGPDQSPYLLGDTAGRNMEWWPEDLRIREMPISI